jgi:hypothetical protein
MKNVFLRLLAVAGLLSVPSLALAADPVYTGTAFDKLQIALNDSALFFGAVLLIAVLVTGFFLGRKWLRSVG